MDLTQKVNKSMYNVPSHVHGPVPCPLWEDANGEPRSYPSASSESAESRAKEGERVRVRVYGELLRCYHAKTLCGYQCKYYNAPQYTISRQRRITLVSQMVFSPHQVVHHTFMQCWLPACSCETIPWTRNERGLSCTGRECWRTKVINYYNSVIRFQNH